MGDARGEAVGAADLEQRGGAAGGARAGEIGLGLRLRFHDAVDAAAVDEGGEAGHAGSVGDGERVGAVDVALAAVLEDLIERGARELVVDLDGGDLAPQGERRTAAIGHDHAGARDGGQEQRGEERKTHQRPPPRSR